MVNVLHIAHIKMITRDDFAASKQLPFILYTDHEKDLLACSENRLRGGC